MSNLNDEQLFYANLDKIIDGEVPESSKAKIESLLKDEAYANLVGQYKDSHGRLQNALEGQFLNEDQSLALRGHVQDMKELSAVEEEEIERLGAANKLRTLTKNAVLYGVLLFIGYQIAGAFMPEKVVKFDPLESFTYETLALEENLEERIDLKTDSIDDVKEFLKNYPSLKAKGTTISVPSRWTVEGASVIDYEVAKISVVAFTKAIPGQMDEITEEREEFDESGEPLPTRSVTTKVQSKDILVQYSFFSETNRFPEFESAKQGNLEYYAFESDKLNMIMWKKDNNYNVLVGRITPVDMAKFASK
ncbi:hypothetical protein N9W79_02420 [bacterium]|nr:hypothetical protein [bacterium]